MKKPASRQNKKPPWTFVICSYLSGTLDKSAKIAEMIEHISKTYPSYKNVKNLKEETILAARRERKGRKSSGKSPRFTICSITEKVFLTDSKWDDDARMETFKNEYLHTSLHSSYIKSEDLSFLNESNDDDTDVTDQTSDQLYACKADESITTACIKTAPCEPIDSKKNIVPFIDEKKIRQKEEGTYASGPVINLLSDEEDDDSSIENKLSATIMCPICNTSFETYEKVGIHVQVHR